MRIKEFFGLLLVCSAPIVNAQLVQEQVVNAHFEDGFTGWDYNACSEGGPPDFPLMPRNGQFVLDLGGDDLPGSFLQQTIPIGHSTYGIAPLTIAFDFGGIGNFGSVPKLRVKVLDEHQRVLATRIFKDYHVTWQAGAVVQMRTVTMGVVVRAPNKSITLRFEDVSADAGIAVDPLIDNVRVFRMPL